ncbi:YbjN domain-containing protein [Phascolarctobacterium sp.]|uniref:YbjN domain-containing protein n=1 Tax=Phascolarctobacterium sp. TaxID=2049039 RepID=UPI0026FD0BA4|nr:YbjN domain-containing protein [Phascolarctobacterium sp.]MDO5786953.1 YbjN domain-containing protein [Phascolarctobacterium sp.]MDY5046101.1 YbjN domain-containing protein [Phascolarctobacterium sp.]
MMNLKATKFTNFINERNINVFQMQEIDGDMHPVVYRSAMEVGGQNLPTMLVIDDSIYVMLQVRVGAGLVKESNKAAVMEHMNSLNENYKVFKYYANENGDIVIESCIPTTDEEFMPELVHAVIDVVLKHLNEEYPKLMKTVWSN